MRRYTGAASSHLHRRGCVLGLPAPRTTARGGAENASDRRVRLPIVALETCTAGPAGTPEQFSTTPTRPTSPPPTFGFFKDAEAERRALRAGPEDWLRRATSHSRPWPGPDAPCHPRSNTLRPFCSASARNNQRFGAGRPALWALWRTVPPRPVRPPCSSPRRRRATARADCPRSPSPPRAVVLGAGKPIRAPRRLVSRSRRVPDRAGAPGRRPPCPRPRNTGGRARG